MRRGTVRARGGGDVLGVLSGLAAGCTLAAMVMIALMILAFALPVLTESGTASPFSWDWLPASGAFGILPMLTGSLLLAGLALLLGWPLALGLCAWRLCTPARGPVYPLVGAVIRLMTAIPTVVYGFAAVFLLTPLIRAGFSGSGLGWLTASLMLTVLILPTLALVLEAGLRPRLEKLCPQGLALGLSRWELFRFFVLPQARSTLLTAAILGFGRAAGDTLLPLMLAGNAPHVPEGLSQSLRALTAHMALVTANEVGGAAYNSLFVAGMLLLGINVAVSLILRRLATGGSVGTEGAGGAAS